MQPVQITPAPTGLLLPAHVVEQLAGQTARRNEGHARMALQRAAKKYRGVFIANAGRLTGSQRRPRSRTAAPAPQRPAGERTETILIAPPAASNS